MSHNKIRVDNQDPNSVGSIDLNMSSYINESSPVTDQVIKYNGSDFVNGSNPSSVAALLKLGLHFNPVGWGGGNYYYSVGDYFTIRDYGTVNYADTGFDYNNATTTNSPLSNNRWCQSIDIPESGTYLFIRTVAMTSGTSMTFRHSINAGEFGMQAYIENSSNTNGAMIWGIATCVQNDIFRTVVKAKVGSVKNFEDEEMRTISILIFKLA